MALKDIIEKIHSDGVATVAAIETKRDAEVAAINSRYAEFVTERKAQANSDTERRAGKVAERILAKARHQKQFIAGAAAEAKLESVFMALRSELLTLNETNHLAFINQQLALLPNPKGGKFIVSKNRAEETTKALVFAGISASMISVEDGNVLLGGFLYSTADQEYDCSFRGLLNTIRDRESVTIANKLTN